MSTERTTKKRLPLDTPARVMLSLAAGCFIVMIYAAVDALIFQDMTKGAPEFGRLGIALWTASGFYQWHRRRISS